jgi:HK97 family phage prohead protease
MSDIVHATFTSLELRVPDESQRFVEGIVVPWGETSFLTPDPKGERFTAGSLTRSIGERGHRLKLFHAHNHDRAIGRAVEWRPDDAAGCWAQFRIAATPAGDEVLTEVQEGMLDAFSVGFRPIRMRRGPDGAREVLEAALHEVSIAPVGAYDGARVLATRTPVSALVAPLPPMPEINLAPLPMLTRW